MNPTRAIFLGLIAGCVFVLLACTVGKLAAFTFYGVFGSWMFVKFYRSLT